MPVGRKQRGKRGRRTPQVPPKTSSLSNIPSELLGKFMQYLGTDDLKACRLVSTLNHEATRALFRTLRLEPNLDSFGRACRIMGQPRLAALVQVFDYDFATAYDEYARLEQVLEVLQQLKPKTISLEWLYPEDIAYLLSPVQPVNRFLCKARQFKLTINNWNELVRIGPNAGKRFRKLSNQLATVADLCLGLAEFPNIPSVSPFEIERDISNAMLQGRFARLANLTLENIVDCKDSVLCFLEQHKTTLKSLTLKNLILSVQQEEEDTRVNIELKAVMRFILLLNKGLDLEKMSFQGKIWAGSLFDAERNTGIKVLCPQIEEDGCHIRHHVTEYICHRGEFPFQFLRPYIEDLIHGRLDSIGRYFVIRGEEGTGAEMRITPEHDHSWKYECSSMW
ncbi:hypothetical protein H2200_003959 [Cladophialophora chaetospira]|uniref:F-box domain-containing protein n=1 Tax=Cladophialophora chaetospira TaxID=386627 RepID=A0AA38XFB2_9EURO|nr:hypothetical protein H2200_003959 [Cladophialophora chaetospira]